MKKKYTKYIILAALVVSAAVIVVWYAIPVPFVSKDVASAYMSNARLGSGKHVEISSQQCEQIFEVLKEYKYRHTTEAVEPTDTLSAKLYLPISFMNEKGVTIGSTAIAFYPDGSAKAMQALPFMTWNRIKNDDQLFKEVMSILGME
ncbi:MAG: hypothetical protein K6A91_05865 [Clostridia bacterium]|nr:hypothetical protein [Clostridia bacterium]